MGCGTTTDVAALNAKRHAALGQCHVDVGFWGGIVPGNGDQIEPLIAAGVRGFKCFMTPSGVDEFASVSPADLVRALPVLARSQARRPLLIHAEDPLLLRPPHGDPRLYSTFLATRPADAEVAAIRTIAAPACLFVATFMTAAHLVLVWEEQDDPNLLRHAQRAKEVGRNPRIISYEIGFGPSASYYAWEAAGRPVHGVRGK
jgi:allantoinase